MECIFIGSVKLDGVLIDGAASISKCKFNDKLSLRSATIKGKVVYSKNTINGMFACIRTTFYDNVNFNDQCFEGHFECESSCFQKDANFTNCDFRSNASFKETKFVGATFFKDATFNGETSFQKSSFYDLDMVDSNYLSTVSFKKSVFNGLANLNGLSARKNVDFSYVETKGKLLLSGLQIMRLWLLGCNFDVSVVFRGCSIGALRYETHKGERVAFNRCKVGDPQLFIQENSQPSKKDSNEAKWAFSNQDCSGLTFLNMSLEGTDFLGADIVDTRFISCNWEKGGKYSKVSQHDEICKTGNRENLYLLYSLYQQLKKNLEDARDYQSSGDFHYREMELRSKLSKERKERRVERSVLMIYSATSDYGENYVKLAAWFALSFFLATFLVSSSEVVSTIGFRPFSADYLMQYIYCMYARVPDDFKFIVFGLIPSGFNKAILLKKVFSLTVFSRAILVLQGIVAIVFAALFVMAIRRRFKR